MFTDDYSHSVHPHFRVCPDVKRGPGEYELKAPRSKFRAIAVDAVEDTAADYLLGDFTSFGAAIEAARARGGCLKPAFVYDDNGTVLAKFGSY